MRSKMDDTGIFISEFEKNIVIIKTSSLEFHIFVKKSECLKYRGTMPHLGIFGLEFEKFAEKTKIPIFQTKNGLLEYFEQEIGTNIVLFEISTLKFA